MLNPHMTRREFLLTGAIGSWLGFRAKTANTIVTVNGEIPASNLGLSLIHEHFLVDFIGADKTSTSRWSREKVVNKVLPYLKEAKELGVKTIFDCTPAFLGRDPQLLLMLAEQSGLQMVTNTGYYGAVQSKYLPGWAFVETADQLADRWVREFENGIDGTGVRPGFIKISVDVTEPLLEVHEKLVRAAARTHLRTGLTICSHTGPAIAAFQELELLRQEGVAPDAFVWVHAQAEKNKDRLVEAAGMGTWISLDGIGWGDLDEYADTIALLKERNLLHRVLISHDAGWYKPDEPDGTFVGYTNIFKELWPRLLRRNFSQVDRDQLLNTNPAEAFALKVKRN